MTLVDCPKHDGCSANVGPCDPSCHARNQINGDPVCFYLNEAVKEGAAARFKGRSDEEMFQRATEMLSRPGLFGAAIKYKLKQAAKNGSRIDIGQRLARSGDAGGMEEQPIRSVAPPSPSQDARSETTGNDSANDENGSEGEAA